jgi:hypothetical protein
MSASGAAIVKTLLLPSSINASPGSARLQVPSATRRARTRLKSMDRAAERYSPRKPLSRIRLPSTSIAQAAGMFPASRPNRCSPK